MSFVDLVSFLIFPNRSRGIATRLERASKKDMSLAKVRIQLHGFTMLSDRFGIMPSKNVAKSEVRVHDHVKRVELDCALQVYDGLIELAQRRKNVKPKKVVSGCVVRI